MDDNALHELTVGYAMNALDGADTLSYEQHLARCPRCQDELAALSAAAAALAFGVEPAEPPAALRERILEAARAERSNVVPLHRRFRPVLDVRLLAAAATVAAVALGVWNVVLRNRLDESHAAAKSYLLRGAPGSVVVAPDGQATMVVSNLRALPSGKTYEAWVIRDGMARPAGTFAGGAKTVVVHLGRPVSGGSVVGVTVEPAGGSRQPTSRPLLTSEQI